MHNTAYSPFFNVKILVESGISLGVEGPIGRRSPNNFTDEFLENIPADVTVLK